MDGESIVQDFGRSYKIFKLLHYFITFNNKKLLPESIIDNLYQDSDSFDPKNMLRAQIYRLRQSIKALVPQGSNEEDYLNINFYNGYYVLEMGPKVRLDVDIFEDLIREGDSAREKNINKSIDIYMEALDLYRGNYLEESSYEIWLVPFKSYYRRIYTKALFTLLDLLGEKRRYGEIIEACERALLYINEEEGLHIYMIEAMLKLGQVKNALSYYEFISPNFLNEFGSVGSSGMKNVYKKIQSQFIENKNIDIRDIEVKLEEEDQSGPLLCSSDYFKFVYSSQKRMRKHEEERDYLALITLADDGQSKEDLRSWEKLLKTNLDKLLRKGDIYSFWNDNQVLVLLKDVRIGGVEKIHARISAALNDYSNYEMKIKYSPIKTDEPLESFSGA